ncbi:hypothetical protein PoB_001792600 [Plakobranchus ocellatus]|uniref:Uncharacterized protein n=1 Tax=Plakobranchus ocellatus TaxID=259542 RepID=A0AAV3Z9V1_9GAST|nr:hypothetical protein PoB_001792600 [Plakobranchus ocellatus]
MATVVVNDYRHVVSDAALMGDFPVSAASSAAAEDDKPGGPREDSEGDIQTVVFGELYRQTNKTHAWDKDFLGHQLGEGAIVLQVENVEKVRAAPRSRPRRRPLGVGSTVACESALRSAGTLLSRVRAPLPAPWPDGGPESLRSPCCGLAIYKNFDR